MLDLIEHLAGWGQGPLLIVCLARDELLDRRPSWGGGRRNATTISLDPLSATRPQELVGRSAPVGRRAPSWPSRWRERSGGNPLFAEEMVNRLREEEDGGAGRAPRQRPRRARGTPRRTRARRAPPPAGRLGRRPELLGRDRRRARRRSAGRPVARRPGRQGSAHRLGGRAGSPASGSSPSSTRWSATSPTRPCRVPSARGSTSRSPDHRGPARSEPRGCRRTARRASRPSRRRSPSRPSFPAAELLRMRVECRSCLRGGRRRGGCALLERRGARPLHEGADLPAGLEPERAGPGRGEPRRHGVPLRPCR